MIEVPMTNDIRKYQPKVLGPFNTRQIICIVLATVIAIPFWGLVQMEMDDKILVMCAIMFPIIACGWITMDGLPFEKLFIRMLYFYVLTPKKRKYVSSNTYREILNKSKKQTKDSKKKKKVEYSNKSKVYF